MGCEDKYPAKFFGYEGADLFMDQAGNVFDSVTGCIVSGVHDMNGQKVYSSDALGVDQNPMIEKMAELFRLLMNTGPLPPQFSKRGIENKDAKKERKVKCQG